MPNNDSVKLPEVMVFAGPNGSGKSTITRMAKEAPEVCPVCNHPRDYFQLKSENY